MRSSILIFIGLNDEVSFNVADDAYAHGKVAEVSTLAEFNSALALHKDGTGLPIVVDFFSNSCGPCKMIAPTYRKFANEFKGRAVFLKIDINRNRQTAQQQRIRSMPTFQFFVNGKQVSVILFQTKKKYFLFTANPHQYLYILLSLLFLFLFYQVSEFSGADGRRLHSVVSELANKAEKKGTYVNQHVTEQSLTDFYTKHDESKIDDVQKVVAKYGTKTVKLIRILKKKYAAIPKISNIKIVVEPDEEGTDDITGK